MPRGNVRPPTPIKRGYELYEGKSKGPLSLDCSISNSGNRRASKCCCKGTGVLDLTFRSFLALAADFDVKRIFLKKKGGLCPLDYQIDPYIISKAISTLFAPTRTRLCELKWSTFPTYRKNPRRSWNIDTIQTHSRLAYSRQSREIFQPYWGNPGQSV